MEYRLEFVEGNEFIRIEEGTTIWQIPVEAVASWGTLLGLTDPAEVVKAIIRFRETPVGPGEPNVWTPLYAALDEGLTELSKAGVPPEHMPDLLDPALGSPVPGPEVLGRMAAAQQSGLAEIDACSDEVGELPDGLVQLLNNRADSIGAAKVAFVDNLAPVVELPQAIAPRSVPEAMDLMNWATLGTVPDILK